MRDDVTKAVEIVEGLKAAGPDDEEFVGNLDHVLGVLNGPDRWDDGAAVEATAGPPVEGQG